MLLTAALEYTSCPLVSYVSHQLQMNIKISFVAAFIKLLLQSAHGSVWQCMAASDLLLLFSINTMQSGKIVVFVIHVCLVSHSIYHGRSTVGSIYSKV